MENKNQKQNYNNEYKEIEQEIKDKGYKTIETKYINKLIELFKEMLTYKNKSYSDNWTFKEWIDNIDTYYHFYHTELQETLYEIIYGEVYIDYDNTIEVTETQKILQLEKLCDILTEKENDYKKYSNYYKEYELKDGETYEDLYYKQKEKFVELFKEMLDYTNYNYDKTTNDFNYIKSIIIDEYPFYTDILIHLDAIIFNPSTTYIELLDSMEKIYNNLSKNYKNREQLLKKYQLEQEIEWTE